MGFKEVIGGTFPYKVLDRRQSFFRYGCGKGRIVLDDYDRLKALGPLVGLN
jgi:hypothetical protein